jgi:hypothetical protein
MRGLLLSLILLSSCFAQAGESLSFNLEKGTDAGCIKISYISTSYDFPVVDNGVVTTVRFFFSKKGKFDITENSPFQETRPAKDENGSNTVSPDLFCGFAPGHYYFKYGLYDSDDKLLEFMTDDQWTSSANSVEVEDTP